MTQAKTLSVALVGCILSVGCAAEDPATDGAGGGGDYSGEDNNTGGPDVDDEGADVEPTYPTQHPRIYIEANRERLKAALDAGTPAATKFKAVPLNSQQRFTALQSGEIDLLARNTTVTQQRDTALGAISAGINFFDGQGFLVPKALGVKSAKDLDGASV